MVLVILGVIAVLSIRIALGLENVRMKQLVHHRNAVWAQLDRQSLEPEQLEAARQQLRVSLLENRHFRHALPATRGFVLCALSAIACTLCLWMDILTARNPAGFGFFHDLAAPTGVDITCRILLILYGLRLLVSVAVLPGRIRWVYLFTPLAAGLVLPFLYQCVSLSILSVWVTEQLWLLVSLMVLQHLTRLKRRGGGRKNSG